MTRLRGASLANHRLCPAAREESENRHRRRDRELHADQRRERRDRHRVRWSSWHQQIETEIGTQECRRTTGRGAPAFMTFNLWGGREPQS